MSDEIERMDEDADEAWRIYSSRNEVEQFKPEWLFVDGFLQGYRAALSEQSERERLLECALAQAVEYAECNDHGAPWLHRGRALLHGLNRALLKQENQP